MSTNFLPFLPLILILRPFCPFRPFCLSFDLPCPFRLFDFDLFPSLTHFFLPHSGPLSFASVCCSYVPSKLTSFSHMGFSCGNEGKDPGRLDSHFRKDESDGDPQWGKNKKRQKTLTLGGRDGGEAELPLATVRIHHHHHGLAYLA